MKTAGTAGVVPRPLPLKKRAVRWCISAFILVHLYIMFFWGMPASRFRAYMTDPVNEYVIKTGLWHSWDMFSPDPISVIYRVHAQIHYRDGSMDFWEFPRMEKFGYFDRMQKERWRKYRERIRQDNYSTAWDDAARYVARLHNNPTNPPKQIVLVREWDSIPPIQFKPGTFDYRPYQKMRRDFDYLKYSMRFRFYDVMPGDL